MIYLKTFHNFEKKLKKEYEGLEPSSQDVLTMGYQFTSYGVVEMRNDYNGYNWKLTTKGKNLYAQMMCVKTNKVK